MGRIRFQMDPEFEKNLLREAFVFDLLEDLVDRGAQMYADGVPVDLGDLRDSIFGDVALEGGVLRGRVGADDWKSWIIEAGSSRNEPDGSLRRAIEALGLTIRDGAEDRPLTYTTKAGKTRTATQAQIDNWTRGSA